MTPAADTPRAPDAAPASLAADFWPPEAIEAIRAASLELLARVGVRADSAQAAALLEAAGGSPGPVGRVLLPAPAVAAALESCRGEYLMVARDPERDLALGPAPGRIHVHNMGEAPSFGDPRTGRARPATFRDQALAARVMHQLRYPDCINSLVTPGDVPADLHPLYSYLAIAAETDKPIGGPGQDHAWQTPVLFEMATAVLSARPGGVPSGGIILEMGYSPVSPLHLGAGVCDGIIAAAGLGMAVQVLTNPVAGTTAPASLAGALALQDAEILAGVVLAQAAAPGTACGYGARLAVADPRDGRLLCGAGQWSLASVGATLLARRHGLACDCYGPDTSAPLVDVQAGYQQALPALAGALARPCMMSGIGAWGDASTCLELLVVGDAIYRVALDTLEPPVWDEDALDVDAIIEGVTGQSGFLGTRHTRRWLRGNRASEDVSWRGGTEQWIAAGSPDALERARERVRQALAQEPVGLPADVEDELCRLIDEAADRLGLSGHPDPRRLLDEARA